MRRLLILGATGMLGHRLARAASGAADIEVWATVRDGVPPGPLAAGAVLAVDHLVGGVDAAAPPAAVRRRLADVLAEVRPDVVVNCVGVVKQRREAGDDELLTAVNARFPHLLAEQAGAVGAALVHLSTDCVFDGAAGAYDEDDPVSATDGYGRSKAEGEPDGTGVVVLRTSMIGRELAGTAGLLEWFLAADPPVPGYRRARFSGLSTEVLAELLLDLVRRPEPLTGRFHVAADPIDKASLLALLASHYRPGIEVVPVDGPEIDRTLDGRRFAAATGFAAPSWPAMVAAMAADPFPYDRWRADRR